MEWITWMTELIDNHHLLVVTSENVALYQDFLATTFKHSKARLEGDVAIYVLSSVHLQIVRVLLLKELTRAPDPSTLLTSSPSKLPSSSTSSSNIGKVLL